MAINDLLSALNVVNNKLNLNTFLTSNKIQLADLMLVSVLFDCFNDVLTQDKLDKIPNVTRVFKFVSHMKKFVEIFGKYELCKEQKAPLPFVESKELLHEFLRFILRTPEMTLHTEGVQKPDAGFPLVGFTLLDHGLHGLLLLAVPLVIVVIDKFYFIAENFPGEAKNLKVVVLPEGPVPEIDADTVLVVFVPRFAFLRHIAELVRVRCHLVNNIHAVPLRIPL